MPRPIRPKHTHIGRYRPVTRHDLLARCDSCDAVIFRRISITRLLVFTPAKGPGHYGARMTARLCGLCARRERMGWKRLRRRFDLRDTITCESCTNTVPVADALRRRVRMTRMRPTKHSPVTLPSHGGKRGSKQHHGRRAFRMDSSYVTGYVCKPCANAELMADVIPNPTLPAPARVARPVPRGD